MGSKIYWKKYDEPKKYTHQLGEKSITGEMSGEYVCTDERVEKFFLFGCLSAKPFEVAKVRASLIMKNGDRWESDGVEINISPDNAQSAHDTLIQQAEQYLDELNP